MTTANLDDRKPVSEMADEFWGCLYGNKGYISGPLELELANKGVTPITDMKKNMKPKVMKLWDRLMLRKRCIIETVFD
ncbi:Mobile element protein [Candidatus Enterovibrio escicola]|uniref:Mobile element protein n=1 Tax=Candidatus Enterovibrio escicola TaxID=1927127 RepID=A0A2A5T2E4_9GAMM|nr:Mobile element protein [Candidatus Enterovibrio escacola]